MPLTSSPATGFCHWCKTTRPAAGLVTDEFLQDRVAEYYRGPFGRSLLEYMGMLPEEHAAWFLTGHVPSRVARVWASQAAAWHRRGCGGPS